VSHKKTSVSMLTLLALGVVFGDIGTSPIYAFQQSVSGGAADISNIFGVISLIFWALMIVVSIKYLTFVLRADNKGEGGVLALYSLLPRGIRYPSGKVRYSIYFALLLGTAFLFGDGVLTPAISVLSAVEGMGEINQSWVHFEVPITVAILAILFLVQSKGTHKIGRLFGPICLIWFVTIGGLGLRQVAGYPRVLKALSPMYALHYVAHNGLHTFIVLSSVILAITGVEALYADMGHFGKRPIRLAWVMVVAPALVLNYLGQAALEITQPKLASALFFNMAPGKAALIYLVLISTSATIIASQALISGVASISRQAIQLGLFPRLKIIHTSEDHSGQIYVPVINTIVGFGSIFLVIIFGSSAKLANAYSFAIAGTMLITTVAFYIVAVKLWKWNGFLITSLCLILGIIDIGFFSSTATKVFKGAWVPLVIALLIVYAMLVWRKGQSILAKQLSRDLTSWSEVEDQVSQGRTLVVPTIGIFLTSNANKVPQAAVSQMKNLHVIPARIILVSITTADIPYVSANGTVTKINDRVSQVSCTVGYLDVVNVPKMLTEGVLTVKEEAAATYYLADRKLSGPDSGDLRGMQDKVFTFLHRNASTAAHYFGLPEDRVVTLAVNMDL
jgi:KUP system potassium uptake protein